MVSTCAPSGHAPCLLTPAVASLIIAVVAAIAPAAQTPDAPPDPAEERQTAALLTKEMDLADLAGKRVTLMHFLERVSDSLAKLNQGKEVLILIATKAFKVEDAELTTEKILTRDVQLPASARKMKTLAAFRLALQQFPGKRPLFVVRRNYVEFTTQKSLDEEIARALKRGIAARFDKQPVAEALRQVVEDSGEDRWANSVRVEFGREAGTRRGTRVTAAFPRGTPLRKALVTLTREAGLDFVPVANVIYVTTPDIARRIRSGQRLRSDVLDEIYGEPSQAKPAQPPTHRYGDRLPEGAPADFPPRPHEGHKVGEPATLRRGYWVMSVAFSTDGKTLASAGGKVLKLWDTGRAKEKGSLPEQANRVAFVVFSPDGQTLAAAAHVPREGEEESALYSAAAIQLWDVKTSKIRATLPGEPGVTMPLAFSPDGKTLAVAGDAAVRLWEVATAKPRAVLRRRVFDVTALAFSPDGKMLAVGCRGVPDDKEAPGYILLWDLRKREARSTLRPGRGHAVYSLAFSPDGKVLAQGDEDGRVLLWDLASHRVAATLHWAAVGYEFTLSLSFTPDGKYLAAGTYEGGVRVWAWRTGRQVANMLDHQNTVQAVSFSPDGRLLASGGRDGTVRLWQVTAIVKASK